MKEATRAAPAYTLLGLDPGIAFTGFAIATVRGRSTRIENVKAIGLLTSTADKRGPTISHDRFERAGLLNSQLRWIVEEYDVDAIAAEHSFHSQINHYTNFASGMLFGAIAALDLPALLVWPQQVKAAAARKGASKKEVIAWALKETEPHGIPWPTSSVPNSLGLDYRGKQVAAFAEHPADALATIQAGICTEEWRNAPDRQTPP